MSFKQLDYERADLRARLAALILEVKLIRCAFALRRNLVLRKDDNDEDEGPDDDDGPNSPHLRHLAGGGDPPQLPDKSAHVGDANASCQTRGAGACGSYQGRPWRGLPERSAQSGELAARAISANLILSRSTQVAPRVATIGERARCWLPSASHR